jgi:hypothetical protein
MEAVRISRVCGLLAAVFGVTGIGCGDSSAPAQRQGLLGSVAASDQTRADLAISQFDVYPLQKGRIEIEAIGEDGATKGVLDVSRLNGSREIAAEVEDAALIRYDVKSPGTGTRIVDLSTRSIVEDSLIAGSPGEGLVEAFNADVSNLGPAVMPQSAVPPQDRQSILVACWTQTACYGAVLLCDQWCYDTDIGGWVTSGWYACGVCLGLPW